MAKLEASSEVRRELEGILEGAYRISVDLGGEVEEILKDGRGNPLSQDQAIHLLTRVVTCLKEGAQRRGDRDSVRALEADVAELIAKVVSEREDRAPTTEPQPRRMELESKFGIEPKPVVPSPVFHGRVVPMLSGFAKTKDIELWEGNLRLDIHLAQFRQRHGHEPTPPELLDIMLSRMALPGVSEEDEFEIVKLARSIAVNGVQRPPILDTDWTLKDGNRRVAACRYILSSDEFTSAEKERAESIFVWQLTEHATEEDREAVIVALNFEPDHKEEWPEYVKARKLFAEWEAMLEREPRPPTTRRQSDLKRQLSKKYALGPDTSIVNRYLKMVSWANDFEHYHVADRQRDEYEVKHGANEYFQYFDELAKGHKPGGVAWTLEQDEPFKHLAFDLLLQGKFKNWRQIRDLKYIADNEEARGFLTRARDEPDEETAEELVDNAIAIARTRRAEHREVGANTRIETFVTWLEELPVRSFRDVITAENLKRLLRALRLVERQASLVLSKKGSV